LFPLRKWILSNANGLVNIKKKNKLKNSSMLGIIFQKERGKAFTE
jgi:hypothetical protein